MSESERRRKYRYDRVLIETARVLSSTFDDAVVYLSGVQLEMLRNVTQYLRRLDTYVTEYNPGYYLTPTIADYDDILAIVADLEEVLMGNPNTIWGYNEPYRDTNAWPTATAGTQYLGCDVIPAGSVCRLEGVAFKNDDSILTRVIVKLIANSVVYALVDVDSPAANRWHSYSLDRTMEAGDYIEFEFQGIVQDDYLRWQMVGNMMVVPE